MSGSSRGGAPGTSGEPVTVVIPAYDAARHLGAAIESVLVQTRPAAEIVVVDDASTDDSLEIARCYDGSHDRLVLHRSSVNRGVCAARNIGLGLASGSLVCMLDADDRLHPEALEELVGALARRPSAALAFAGVRVIDERGDVRRRHRLLEDLESPFASLIRANALHCGSGVLFRKSDAIEAGGYDERLRERCNEICGDWDFYLSMSVRGPFAAVRRHLVDYREHHGSMSANVPRLLRAHEEIVRKIEWMRPDLTREIVMRGSADLMYGLARRAIENGDIAGARLCLGLALRHAPLPTVAIATRQGGRRARRGIARLLGLSGSSFPRSGGG